MILAGFKPTTCIKARKVVWIKGMSSCREMFYLFYNYFYNVNKPFNTKHRAVCLPCKNIIPCIILPKCHTPASWRKGFWPTGTCRSLGVTSKVTVAISQDGNAQKIQCLGWWISSPFGCIVVSQLHLGTRAFTPRPVFYDFASFFRSFSSAWLAGWVQSEGCSCTACSSCRGINCTLQNPVPSAPWALWALCSARCLAALQFPAVLLLKALESCWSAFSCTSLVGILLLYNMRRQESPSDAAMCFIPLAWEMNEVMNFPLGTPSSL